MQNRLRPFSIETPPVKKSKGVQMVNNHSPEAEAIRDMMRKLKRWDERTSFSKKIEWLESKDKPDWMKNV